MKFNGFKKQGIEFLKDLASNNNKEWFEKNRETYQKYLLEPMKQLVSDLELSLKNIDSKIETSPSINKTISKIFRDTRFSNNKLPFRTDLWLTFKRSNKIYGNVPEFYFYFTTEEYQYGMGFYSASPSNMEKIRKNMIFDSENFKKIIDFYNSQKTFRLMGTEYKKQIHNELPVEFQAWLKKKSIYVCQSKKIDPDFYSSQLKEDLENAFNTNEQLYHFLMESIQND